jgi:hypothetical protein
MLIRGTGYRIKLTGAIHTYLSKLHFSFEIREKRTHMKFKISADTLNRSGHCKNNYSCVSGDTSCLCEVQSLINNSVLFVQPCSNSCSYIMPFGHSYICSCPTRKEIYRYYKK